MSTNISFDKEKNILTIGNQSVVLHCHHYNMFLQQSISDLIGEENARSLQISSAQRIITKLYENIKPDVSDPKEILDLGSVIFKKLGYGIIDFSEVSSSGGQVVLPMSHYAFNWFEKFGPARSGVCLFAMGFTLATINHAFGTRFGLSDIWEKECRGMNPEEHEYCVIEVGKNGN